MNARVLEFTDPRLVGVGFRISTDGQSATSAWPSAARHFWNAFWQKCSRSMHGPAISCVQAASTTEVRHLFEVASDRTYQLNLAWTRCTRPCCCAPAKLR